MVTLEHALAPLMLLRDILRIHDFSGAHLTDADAPSFTKPLYVIESAAVDNLLLASKRGVQPTVIGGAAELLSRGASLQGAPIRWHRVKVPALYRIDSTRWPETFSIQSASDAEILRQAVQQAPVVESNASYLLDSCKRVRSTADGGVAYRKSDCRRVTLSRSLSPRVRVLYVSAVSHFVGASQSLCHIIDGLDRSRFEPFAIVPYAGVVTNELARRGVDVFSPNGEFNAPTLEAFRFVHGIMQEIDPDVVHSNHAVGQPMTTLLALKGVPFIQDVRLAEPKLFKVELHAADAIIAISAFVRKRILELDVDPRKIFVIFPGVDSQQFRSDPGKKPVVRQRLGIPVNEFVVATVARMSRQKRIDIVVKAVGHVRRALGRGHLLLVAPRDSDWAYHDEISALIRAEGIAPHTTYIDFVLDVPSVLQASDAMALVSKDEALGRVVIEGMAMGLPVIVGDSGGSKEIIESGRTGFVVPGGNIDGLASILADLAVDPDYAALIGTAAAERIRTGLTDSHCAAKVMEVYERVLAKRTYQRAIG